MSLPLRLPLRLTVGLGPYDHTRDLVTGAVRTHRLELAVTEGAPEEIFEQVEQHGAFDVAEFSLAKYVAWRDKDRDDYSAIPVFPSRVPRQGSFFVASDAAMHNAASLDGCRVGIPEWVQTAGIWARGWLEREVGIPLHDIEWHQGGVDRPGRPETVAFVTPPGVSIRPVVDRSLDELLLAGEPAAVLSARPPASIRSGRSRRLLPDPQQVEAEHVAATGIYPIMHVVLVRSTLLEARPWVARALVDLFTEALRRSEDRMADPTASYAPVPWLAHHTQHTRYTMGYDPFAYGLGERNLRTLGAFLDHCRSQGVVTSRLDVGELFAPL